MHVPYQVLTRILLKVWIRSFLVGDEQLQTELWELRYAASDSKNQKVCPVLAARVIYTFVEC